MHPRHRKGQLADDYCPGGPQQPDVVTPPGLCQGTGLGVGAIQGPCHSVHSKGRACHLYHPSQDLFLNNLGVTVPGLQETPSLIRACPSLRPPARLHHV